MNPCPEDRIEVLEAGEEIFEAICELQSGKYRTIEKIAQGFNVPIAALIAKKS